MTSLFTLLAQASEEYVYRSKWERRWDALKSGDPLTWGVVIVTLLIVFGWPLLKKKMSGGGGGGGGNDAGQQNKH